VNGGAHDLRRRRGGTDEQNAHVAFRIARRRFGSARGRDRAVLADNMTYSVKSEADANALNRRRVAWILILIVDVAYVAWGATVAVMPDGLLGPGGKAILPAGYEGYSGGSWSELLRTSPMTANYMIVLFRMYGIYCVVFGFMGSAIALMAFRRGDRWAWWALLVGNSIALVSAMRYDWIVNAIGPFELTEYLGLAAVYGALAVTAPFSAQVRPLR
jgi:hypothetical protein